MWWRDKHTAATLSPTQDKSNNYTPEKSSGQAGQIQKQKSRTGDSKNSKSYFQRQWLTWCAGETSRQQQLTYTHPPHPDIKDHF